MAWVRLTDSDRVIAAAFATAGAVSFKSHVKGVFGL